jgi:hypothetical protein
MIYIYSGNDIKKINSNIKKLSKDREVFKLFDSQVNNNILNEYCFGVSLFGKDALVIIENSLESLNFSTAELGDLDKSKTIFVFLEDSLNRDGEKRFQKYATIDRFENKEIKKNPPMNLFSIAESFERKDKINTWILYRKAIDAGIEPEAISGIIFWKIRMISMVKSRNFSKEEIKSFSKTLISLYHNAHLGKTDFVVGLERFILSSLAK